MIGNTLKAVFLNIYYRLTSEAKKKKSADINHERKKVILGSRQFDLDKNLKKL